ncbi:MAG: CoA ester lyase [Gammaproteobacteria bacterium]|nr:CoA ester lyase [Gammaproteobacteria bacterium]
MQPSELPVWRSMLFVPATAERFVEKAHLRGADALIIDLEDAVAASEKPRARTLVAEVAARVGRAGADVLVRVNRPWRMLVADLEASVIPGICGLLLPKIESADHLSFVDEIVDELEAERGIEAGSIRYMVLIETARGFHNVREIAAGSPRVCALTLGGEDFGQVIGMPEVHPDAMMGFMQQVQVAAREAGILAQGYPGSIGNFSDLEAYRQDIRRARQYGFDGGGCIHPAQVAILNEEFGPSAAEIEHAEALVDVYDRALAAGEGAVSFKGKMIDVPVAERARRVLALRDRIQARAAR